MNPTAFFPISLVALVSLAGKLDAATFADPIPERIAKGNIIVELKPIADGMVAPIGMAVPNDGSGRIFLCDQIGIIWLVTANSGRSLIPVLDIRTRLMNITGLYDERGLLNLAAHPGFRTNGLIYTYTSEPNAGAADFATTLTPGTTNNHQSVIAEWRVDAANTNRIDLASRREILRIDQPQSNNNGGTLRFGPDGFLYAAFGDGGAANDVANGHSAIGNGQDTNSILGKLIRIDVNGANSANGKYGVPLDNPFVGRPGLDEIYAYGLRNPSGFSFDRSNGNLWLGDVGQNYIEEIVLIAKGGNYGWNIKEGTFFFHTNGYVTNIAQRAVPPDLVDPVAQYDHDDGAAVIGGSVYRGSALPALAGRYVFGDWGTSNSPSGRLFFLDTNNVIKELRLGFEDRPLGYYLRGFGEDTNGELYVITSKAPGPAGFGGALFKVVPPPASALTFEAPTLSGGTNLQTRWSGGIGPFTQQRKVMLDEPFCMNTLFTTGATFNAALRNNSGFFRLMDTAHHASVPFTVSLSGINERPSPLTNSSQGFGIFRLEGNSLSFTIKYSGLSGTANAAHIHGPARASVAAAVMIDLQPYHNGAFSSNGSFSGTIVLTDAQKATVMAGLAYVNVHTAANPSGETRGQIAPVNLQASLLGAYENPATSTGARGFGSFTLVGTQLTFVVNYSGLSSVATASHIHGAGGIGTNAGVLIDLAPYNGGSYGTRGTLSGTVNLTPTQFASVVDGLTYVNFHTAANPDGEIRGQIVPHITAVPFTAWISGTNERPTQLVNTANGLTLLSLEGNTLAFNIKYGGLSGPVTAAHIHGPSATTNFSGVQVELMPFANGTPGASGSFSGTIHLSSAQRTSLLNGQSYVNLHTAANPGGEARGNINTVLMSAFATGTAERPTPLASTGSALGLFTLVSTQLNISVVYKGLSSTASASHIHAPASASVSSGVVIDFTPFNGGAYGAAGVASGSVGVTPNVLGYLIDGLGYINFHTVANPGGEVRGQIGR